jgi:nucleoside-diphosphate-sugar epimerase
MDIVLSGATGYLGSRLAAALLQRGDSVTALVRPAGGSRSGPRRLQRLLSLCAAHAEALRLLRLDVEALAAAFPQPGAVVVHCAASYGRAGESDEELRAANVTFGEQLLHAAERGGAATFFYADTALPEGISRYARTKAEFRRALRARSGAVAGVSIALEHVYGPGDDDGKFVTDVARALLRGAPELPLTAGEQERDFLHVDDACAALCLLVSARDALPAPYARVGLGSGQVVRIRDLVRLVAAEVGAHRTALRFGALPYRPDEVMRSCADLGALKALGFSPKISLRAGLADLVAAERAALSGSRVTDQAKPVE